MTKEKVNTPYDDAFRTLIVKCPMLAIPLVNEAFHERYELRENVQTEKDEATFTFPYSALLYLRCPANTPRAMRVTHKVPNGGISYEIPILKVPEYTSDEILEKELYFLIPFHIFAYEKELESTNSDPEKLEDLLRVYKKFSRVLQQRVKEERLTEYERQAIRDMTVKVVSSLAVKWDSIREGVEDIMGGEILELEVDKILNRGIDIGKAEGLREGLDRKTDIIVRNMLLRGMADTDIMAIAECDLECIDRIRWSI